MVCTLRLKDPSAKGTIFQLYAANLYCEALWLNLFAFSIYGLEQIKARRVGVKSRFSTEAQYHSVRTAVHRDQFLFCEILDLPGYSFCDEHVNFDANAVFPTDVEDLPTEAI